VLSYRGVHRVHGLFSLFHVKHVFTFCSWFVPRTLFHVKQFTVCSPFVHGLFSPARRAAEQSKNKQGTKPVPAEHSGNKA
jgi:hypothetical protein